MNTSLNEAVFFIETFMYLLFAVFLFTHRKGNILSNRIFAFFLIFKTAMGINVLLYFYRETVYTSLPFFYFMFSSSEWMIAPLLYLYTRSVLYDDFRLRASQWLHGLPFLLTLPLKAVFYFMTPDPGFELVRAGSLIPDVLSDYYALAVDIQVVSYFVAALFLIRTYRSRAEDIFSDHLRIQQSWLKTVLTGFLVIQSFYLYKHVSTIWTGSYIQSLTPFMHLASLGIVSFIFYRILRNPEIFSGIERRPKYERSPLSPTDMEDLLQRLLQYIRTEKPYLNPDLTLFELSERVEIPSHHLSQILNTKLNRNFFNFINEYRVEESKRLLSEATSGSKTVLEILYETGFNSKSVFNTAFKKFTGMTPTEYRKNHRL